MVKQFHCAQFPQSVTRPLAWLAIIGLIAPIHSWSGEKHVKLVPELHVEQILRYDIHGRVRQHTKTESNVTKYRVPRDVEQEFTSVLRMVVTKIAAENGKPLIGAWTEFETPAAVAGGSGVGQTHRVEFVLGGNGQVESVTGLDDLEPVERIAWQFWISQFAFGWTITGQNVKRGGAWKSEEPENSPSPIANLVWERETTYGQNSRCTVAAESCAVFLTTALLKQKSSIKDSTPEDYKLHELRTSGTANGRNETYDSISEETGLLMRGTEDMQQSMEVVIAKADGTNAVKYTMEAGSYFEAVMVGRDVGTAPAR